MAKHLEGLSRPLIGSGEINLLALPNGPASLRHLDFALEPLEKREMLHGGNRSPEALDDQFRFDQLQPSFELDVLSNDSDPEGARLSISGVSKPKFGTVSIDGDVLVYVPNAEVVAGEDTFYYSISDGRKHDTGKVSLTLTHECIHPESADPVEISIHRGTSDYDNEAFAYSIDASGNISNIRELGSEESADGVVKFHVVEPGTTIGVGIRNGQGDTFYSSGYGANIDLNADGLVHTAGVSENADGSVTLGFEDLPGLGDQDFDDILVTVNLRDSGATLDNAHYDYSSTAPSVSEGLIANGSFELGANTDGYEWYDPADVPGWTTKSSWGNGTLEIVRSEGDAAQGNTFIELDRVGHGVSQIHQDINVVSGQTYLLSFDSSGQRYNDLSRVDVRVDGQSLGNFVSRFGWKKHVVEFTADTTGTVELEFVQKGSRRKAVRLDSVQLYEVGTNLVSNGDFSSPDRPRYYPEEHVPDWDVPGTDNGRIRISRTRWFGETNQFARLDLSRGPQKDHVIQQSIATTEGQEYVLRFDTRSMGRVEALRVYWEGNVVATIHPVKNVWTSESLVVVGSGGESELRFEQVLTHRTRGDVLLDNIGLHELDCVENLPPVLDAIEDQQIDEGSTLTLIANATDPDQPDDSLSYSLADASPAGLTIDPDSGEISWTPTEAQGPGVFDVTVIVTDDQDATDSTTFQIEVLERNVAPVLEAIADQNIDEESQLDLVVTGSDSDLPANDLQFSLVSAPDGATINANTGRIRWTPTEANGPGQFEFEVSLSDGELSDEKSFTVTVNEVNQPPVLETIANQTIDEGDTLSATAAASDSDVPANTLTYQLLNSPSGSTIDPMTGQISWTTGLTDSGVYTFEVEVSDGDLADVTDFEVTVNDVNEAPQLAPISDKTIDEETELNFRAVGSDPNSSDTLTYNLVTGPSGATVGPTSGRVRWTPTEADGPGQFDFVVEVTDGVESDRQSFTVTVNEVNLAPVLETIANQTIDEGDTLSVVASASDDDLPANSLSYSLLSAPSDATIDPMTGQISWLTDLTDDGQYTFEVEVSDGELVDSAVFEVAVNDVNEAPQLASISDKTIDEVTELNFRAMATDPNADDVLTYSLISAPDGAFVNPTIGRIRWTPTEADGPGEFEFVIEVSDGTATDQQDFTVFVNEVNVAPTLAAINDLAIEAGQSISVMAVGTDVDVPANTLIYSLDASPSGATIDPVTGEIEWASVAGGAYDFTVRVTDGDELFDTEDFTVTVSQLEECLFEPGDWSFGESGGHNGMAGSGVAQGCSIVLDEGNSFEVLASISFDVPGDPSHFVFEYTGLSFDGGDAGSISDAFEAALLDENGDSLVHAIADGRDSFFNVSEPGTEQAGANTVVDGNTVSIDLSLLSPGATVNLVLRLVNNDGDTNTTVSVKPIAIADGSLNTPVGVAASDGNEVVPEIDFEALTDVTGSIGLGFETSSFNAADTRLFSGLTLTNHANHPIDGPFLLVVSDISDPNVVASNTDGVTPDGDRFYVIDDLSELATIEPGANTLAQTIEFLNPNGEQFDFELTVLAQPNIAPQFVTDPVTQGTVDLPYVYDSDATDADDDTLNYELMSGPAGLTIDPATGVLNWSPTTGDVGTYAVMVEVTDGRGGRDQQTYTIDVAEERPNRPPVIISTPVVQAFATTEETLETGNLVVNGDFEGGDTGFDSDYSNLGISVGAAQYSITTNPKLAFGVATSYGDFTTGSGNMLAVNGSTTPGDVVWEQTVSVVPGTTYDFATAISSWFPAEPAALLFTVNGQDIGALNAPSETGVWEQLFATWESGTATSATIQIVNANLAFGGNDFALDDIYFGGPRFSNPSYQYQVEAVDADFDPISYVLDEAPEGMSIDGTSGFIGWNPTADQLGTHTVRVIASDGRGGTATQEYEVVVLSDESNSAPVIISQPVEDFFIPGFSNPASGDVTPQRISLDLGNGETFEGTVSVTLPETAGRYADIVLAVDESASMGGDQAWIADMIPLLDQALIDAGIGAEPENPNRFAIVGGGRQNMVSHFLSQQPNTKYTLFGPSGEVISEGEIDEVLPDELLNLQLPENGRYALVIEAENTSELAGGIDVGITGRSGEATRVESLILNQIVNDRFEFPGQPIVYEFSLSTPTLLYFDSLIVDHKSTVEWDLVGPDGVVADLSSIDSSDTENSSPVYSVGAGDYRLTLNSVSDTAVDLKFAVLDLLTVPTVTPGETVNGEFETKVETDAYRFSADEGQLFEFANTATAHSRSRWRLVDEFGDVLLDNNLGTNVNGFELPNSGEYYLLMEAAIFPYEGASQLRETSVYEFTLDVTDPAPANSITLGNTNNGEIEFVGDFVDYAFTLSERSLIYVDSLSDSNISWTLTGPRGVERSDVRFNSTDSFNSSNPVMNLIAGDYSLRVNSNGQQGAFEFKVVDLAVANAITPGASFSGELTVPNETDFYQFDANGGDVFFFDVVTTSDESDTEFKLIDPFGQVVFESAGLRDADSTTIPADGTYTLLVEGWRANIDQDTYTMNVVPVVVSQQSLTLGAETTGTLATPGQQVEFEFSIAENFTLLHFDSLTNRSDLRWHLEGPQGTIYSDRQFSASDANFASNTSLPSTAFELNEGDYVLRVNGLGDAIGDFSFTLFNLNDLNQSTQVSNPVSGAPSTVAGTQTDATQTQIFRFDAVAGDQLSFDATTTDSLTGTTSGVSGDYKLLDPFGRQVFARFLSSDQAATEVSLTGTYFLMVEGRANNVEVDQFSIVITHEGNNPPTPPIGTPTAYTLGTLGSEGGDNSFTFTLTEPTVLYFDAQTNDGNIRHRFSGPRGVEFDNVQTSRSDSFDYNDDYRLWRPGTYQLDFFGNNGSLGPYSFILRDMHDGTEITPGVAFSGELTTPNETDVYNFDADAGDKFFFDVVAASDATNTEYKLVDPTGKRIFTSNRLTDFANVVEVTRTGTYSLLVEGWRGNTGADTYTMNVHKVVDSVFPLTFGAVTQGAVEVPGQQVNYTFSVSDWTKLYFDSFVNDSSINWSLTGPTGTVVSNRQFRSSDSNSISNPVLDVPAGDYTLTVDAVNDVTRPFEFTLFNLADAQAITAGAEIDDALDATLSSNATWTSGASLTGSATNGAIDLARVTDAVRLPNRVVDGVTDFTVEFWYKTTKTGFQSILSAANASEDNGLLIFLDSDTQFEVEDVGAWTIDSVADDQWHHYAITHENGVGTTFYLDGVSQGLDSTTLGTLSVDPNGLVLGQEQDILNGRWDFTQSADGQLDELRIWDTVRSATEVVDNKDQVIAANATGLNAYYRFDETTGNTAADQTDNGFDASFEPFALSSTTKMYQFEADSGDRIFVDILEFNNFSTTPYYRLVDPFGIEVARPAASVDLGPIELHSSGTYTLFFEGRVTDVGLNGEFSYQIVPLGNVNDPAVRTPLAFGDIIDGEMSVRHETDTYSFSLGSDSLVYFDSLTNDQSLNWSLTRGNRSIVNNRRFDQSDSTGNNNPVLNLQAGDYVLSVTSSEAEAYSFRLLDLSDAMPLGFDAPVADEFTIPNQTNSYAFDVVAGERVYFDVLNTSSTSAAYYRIVNSRGKVVVQQTSITDLDVIEFDEAGTYFLLFEARANQTASQTYEFQLVQSTRTELPLVVGDTLSNTISVAGGIVEYKFELTEAAVLVFDSLTDTSTIRWSLEGAGGQLISPRAFSSSDSFNQSNPLLDLLPGEYTLTVDATDENVGDFAFRLLDIQSAIPVVAGTSFAGELTTPNETDIYQFVAAAGDQFLVDVESASDTSDTLYRVVDPYGNIIEQQNSLTDKELATFTTSGTFTLVVEGWRANVDQDTYSINLRRRTVRDVGSLVLGTTVSDTIAAPSEEVAFSFNLANDSLIHFDSLTNRSDLVWDLRGPRGVEYSNIQFNRSDSTLTSNTSNPPVAFELLAGDYTLTVSGVNDATGDFDFALRNLWDASQSTAIDDPVAGTPTSITDTQNEGLETRIYRFNATAGDTYSFDSNSSGVNSDYRLLDPFGRQVFSRFLTSDISAVTVDLTGSYYLLVEGRLANADPDSIDLTVSFDGNVPVPGFSGTPLTLGSPVSSTLASNGIVDAYIFTLNSRSQLNFDSRTNSSAVFWRLSGPKGTEFDNVRFDRSDGFDTNDGVLGGGTLIAGDYQLEVFTTSGSPIDYAFVLNDVADATPITPGTEVGTELVPEELDPSNGTNLYKFDATAGQRFIADFENVSDVNNSRYKLVDPFGRSVFVSNRMNDHDVFTTEFDGTYTLVVEGSDGNTGEDTYTFNIAPVVETRATLAINQATVASISTPGEELLFDFELTEDSLFYFSPFVSSSQIRWRIVDADGFELASDTYNRGPEFLNLLIGTYQLLVDVPTDVVGDASFATYTVDAATSVLPVDGTVATTTLDSQNAVQFFTFDGVAGNHFALQPDFNLAWNDSATSRLTAMDLTTSADGEDGHANIDYALRSKTFRDGAAINVIMVTDEDRDVINDEPNFETLFVDLSERQALLNVVINGTLRDENNTTAIGIDGDGTAYVADGAGGFITNPAGNSSISNISIRQDYVDLALALDGAAWSLNQLRAGGLPAESFTNAFVDVKVAEILEQTSLQLVASNPNADLEILSPATGRYDTIVGGQQYDFDIRLGNDSQPISYDLLFSQGQTVGSIPVYIIAPYEYGAAAVDVDGDTLTWSIVDGPDGLVIDTASGLLAWPGDSVVFGEHEVTIRVDDGRGGFDEQTFTLNVNGGEPSSISGRVFDLDTLVPITVDVVVPGSSNPKLSGAADGTLASSGDNAPDHSPIRVEGLEFSQGGVLTFSATGGTSNTMTVSANATPDGAAFQNQVYWSAPAERGISGFNLPINSLVGVFLSDAAPESNAAPVSLDYSPTGNVSDGIDFTEFTPELQQVFFIGDGVNADGIVQEFAVPDGATRLYLGTADAFGWFNNSGFFDVQVNGFAFALPEISEAIEVNPYTSVLDSPLDTANEFAIEDFEDGSFDLNGVSLTGGDVVPASSTIIDSVDADDGVIDGSGLDGRSWFNASGSQGVTVTFDETVLGELPTQAGLVWTDGFGTITFRAFDANGVLIGELTSDNADSSVIGETAEDTFFGAKSSLGISSIFISNSAGGIEIDHVQYSLTSLSDPLAIANTVYLDQNRNGLLDIGEQSTTTDALGQYSFENLDTGSYVVSLLPQEGWRQVVPSNRRPIDVSLEPGEDKQNVSFGIRNVPLVNTDPEITSEPLSMVVAGEVYEYTPKISELDGDDLEFDLPLAPAGMAVNPGTGTIRWTPRTDQIGIQNVLLRVRDGRGGYDLQYYQIGVEAPNTVPVFVTTPATGPAGVGLPFTYDADATDADGDTLTYSLSAAPQGATINEVTGQLDWTPSVADLGTASFTIVADDGRGLTAEQSFEVAVELNPVNLDPEFVSAPPTDARLGDTYLYMVKVADQNGDPLTLTLDSSPAGMTLTPEGLITWEPTVSQLGPQTVILTVDDGRGGMVAQEFTIDVATQSVNNPPIIVSEPLTSAVVDINYQFTPIAEDANNDTLFWQLVEGPRGMTIDSATGQINWLPTVDDLGTVRVTVEVLDTQLTGAGLSYDLNVRAMNTPPVILSAPPTSSAIGATYLYQVAAEDADQDRLLFSLDTAPTGMTIDAETGRITWSPTAGQDGAQEVAVTVSDSAGASITQTFTIQVATGVSNQLPTITSSANFYATVGEAYTYDVEADDPDGDDLTYALLSAPSGMTIDSQTGLIEWTPAAGDVGSVLVEILVTDPSGGGSLQGFGLQVLAENNAPVITSAAPDDPLSVGETFRYDLLASDADGDFLTYELVDGPDGMVIDGLGRMFWIPTTDQFGTNTVEVTVTDTRGATATQSFDIVVEQDTEAPQVAILLSQNPVNVGEMVDIRVSAIDNVGVESIVLTLDGEVLPLDGNDTARVQLDTVGGLIGEATVTDAEGNETVEQVTIFVSDPNDVDGPTIIITSPTDGGTITAPTDVIGTVMDDTLVSYRLLIAEAKSREFQSVSSGDSNIDNAVIGRVDPTQLLNGSYILRLEALDAGGNGNVIEQRVEIVGNNKVGNYQQSFVDEQLFLGGLSVQLVRTYDSMNANTVGDFGFGWNLTVRSTELVVDLPSSGLEDYGIYTPFAVGTRVYVTEPGGSRVGFTFDPDIRVLPGFGNSLVLASPRFTPDPGVTSRLSVGGGQLFVNEFGELTAGGGVPWNPASPDFGGGFTLTQTDGTRLRIDGNTGQVRTVTDSNGNTLSFREDGIVNDDGVGLTFQRDTQSRITKATNPMGDSLEYVYDENGDLVEFVDFNGNVTTFEYSSERPHYLESIIDPLGRTGQKAVYDEDGRLTRLIDAGGTFLELTHDIDNQIETVTDQLGNDTTFVYDELGNVLTIVDALGGVTEFEYDENSNLISETDALGNTTTYVNDSRGNVLERTDALGRSQTFTYDSRSRVLSSTDALGNTTTNQYDANGNLTRTEFPNGDVVTTDYDSQGNRISQSDGEGNVTQFMYTNNVLSGIIGPNGQEYELVRDANGSLTEESFVIETLAGQVTKTTTFEYDANGEVIGVLNSAGVASSRTLDAAGQIVGVTELDGLSTSQTFDERGFVNGFDYGDSQGATIANDALGRALVTTLDNGTVIENEYDALGRTVSQTVNGTTTALQEYDAIGRLTRTVDINGNSSEFEYDAVGNLIREVDIAGREYLYQYNNANQLIRSTSAGSTTTYQYNDNGDPTRILFVDGTSVDVEYDSNGRVVARDTRDGLEWTYAYHPSGNLKSTEDALGNSTVFGEDSAGQLDAVTDALGRTTGVAYDANDNLVRKVLPLGQVFQFAYTDAGVPVSQTDFNGDQIFFEYDAQRRLIKVTDADDNILEQRTYESGNVTIFSALFGTSFIGETETGNRLFTDVNGNSVESVVSSAGIDSVTTTQGSTAYQYSPEGQIVEVANIDGASRTIEYDDKGLIDKVIYQDGSYIKRTTGVSGQTDSISLFDANDQLLSQLVYTRNLNGRVTSVVESSGRITQFEYNAIGALVKETIINGTTVVREYSYDAVGNRIGTTVDGVLTASTYDANDRILTSGGTVYTFNDNGDLISRSDGVVTEVFEYEQQRLVKVTRSEAGNTDMVEYAYNVNGLLASRTENGVHVSYVWDTETHNLPVLLEAVDSSGDLIRRFEFDGSRYIGYVDSNGDYYRIFTNDVGTIRSYESATGTQNLEFDAYGNLTAGLALEIGFAGGLLDPLTGLTYFSSRWYDSETGRFTQTDSDQGDLEDTRTVNRYIYAANDPINLIDPLGQKFNLVETLNTLAVAGGLLAAGIGLYVASDPVSILKKISGGRLDFEDQTGSSAQFFELNVNLFGRSRSRAGFVRSGRGRQRARGFTLDFSAGLSADIGFELLNLFGSPQRQLFFYIGASLGASAEVSAGASVGGESRSVNGSFSPARTAIVYDTLEFSNYEGQFVSISGGASLKLTFPNPLNPTGRGGVNLSLRASSVAFSPGSYEANGETLYSHTITFPVVSTPLRNSQGFGASFTISAGMGWSYYFPLFDPFVPPPPFSSG